MQTLGNIELLGWHKISFLASRQIASLSVLPTLDWAAEVAQRPDVAVVSGFQSVVERQVLDFLLRGRCGVVCVQARSIYRRCPERFRLAYDQGRVLFVAPLGHNSTRNNQQQAQQRNRYIAQLADALVMSSVTPASSLYQLIAVNPNVTLL